MKTGTRVLRWPGTWVLLIVVALPLWSAAVQLLRTSVGGETAVAQGSGVPSGAILMVNTGSCPAGFSEVAGLAGRVPLGTTVAAADVGGTGGSDSVTPAGTVSQPTFTGSALAAHAHATGTYATSAHSGTAVADHSDHPHTYPQVVNHVHVQTVNSATTGGSSGYTPDTSTNTGVSSSYSTANPTGGVATGTTNGASATLTHSVTQPSAHTLSGSSESVSAGTPAGTVSQPTFTGASLDNRQAFVKMIFCMKS